MKNTLAENLLRFGVKNLSEADKSRLNEQGDSYPVIPVTISVPYKKLANGQSVYDKLGAVKVFAKDTAKTGDGGGTNLEIYSKIISMDFKTDAGYFSVKVNTQKDAAGNIVGTITDTNKDFRTYLATMVGKTLPPSDKKLSIMLIQEKNPSVKNTFYAATTVFNTYNAGVATPTKS